MTTVSPLTDFPDRLSPMVVKELRQGLRTKLFGGTLLVLHGLLVLITLLSGLGSDGSEARGLMDGLITLVLCGVFPLCGFSALAGEIKANTMDMLVLTRLSAGRIVLGKWAAIIFQSLLVTISIVPYYVARYVFGGAELFADLATLILQWLISAVMTAAVVALSTQKHFWLRALIIVVPLFLVGVSSMIRLTVGYFGSGSFSVTFTSLNIAGWLMGSAWLVFAFLSFGATRIAPAASLLSVPKRLINLAALILLPLFSWLTTGTTGLQSILTIILIVACVDALTEEARPLPSHYLPFYRRSWWGWLASWFLIPGWTHGFAYSLLLFALSSAALEWLVDWQAAGNLWLFGCGLWLCALLAQFLSFNRKGDHLGALSAAAFLLYLLTMLSFLLTAVSSRKEEMKWLVCLLPTTAMRQGSVPAEDEILFLAGLIVNNVWPLLLGMLALKLLYQTRTIRKEARQLAAA